MTPSPPRDPIFDIRTFDATLGKYDMRLHNIPPKLRNKRLDRKDVVVQKYRGPRSIKD